MESKFISVIVPAHNEEEYIAQCLQSLVDQNYPKHLYEIIVVDNNSTDKTSEIAADFDVKILQQSSGPVGAVRNAGARAARGQLLAFIDADCVAPNNWLSTGSRLLENKGHAYGGGYNLRPSPYWVEKAWLLENKSPPKDLIGGCIFIRKQDFLLLGMFDERITSGEDTQLSTKLRQMGYTVTMDATLNVVHLGNPITLKHFFTRQIWHSENYLQNWNETKKDITFYLLLLYIASLALLIVSAFTISIQAFSISLAVTLAVPLIFSLKRLLRSKSIIKNLKNLHNVYLLDTIYVLARTLGLFKSAKRAVMKFILH